MIEKSEKELQWRSWHAKDFMPKMPFAVDYGDKILVAHPKKNFLKVTFLEKEKERREGMFIPKEDWSHFDVKGMDIDYTFIHKRLYKFCDRVMIFRYTRKNDRFPVMLLDVERKTLDPIEVTQGLSEEKFNYSTCIDEMSTLVYIFGGITFDLELSNNISVFNYSNFAFENLKTVGNKPSKRHSSSMVLNKGNIYIFGGYSATDFFVKGDPLTDIYMLRLSSLSWYKINSPSFNLSRIKEPSVFSVQVDKVLILGARDNEHTLQVGFFDFKNFEYLRLDTDKAPLYRYNSSRILDKDENLYIVGGIKFGKGSQPVRSNRIDVISFGHIDWNSLCFRDLSSKIEPEGVEKADRGSGGEEEEDSEEDSDELSFGQLLKKEKEEQMKELGLK